MVPNRVFISSSRALLEFELKLESLENRKRGIELVAVQRTQVEAEEPAVQLATVFAPDGSLRHFFSRFEEYERERTSKDEPRHKDMHRSVMGDRSRLGSSCATCTTLSGTTQGFDFGLL